MEGNMVHHDDDDGGVVVVEVAQPLYMQDVAWEGSNELEVMILCILLLYRASGIHTLLPSYFVVSHFFIAFGACFAQLHVFLLLLGSHWNALHC